MQFLKQFTFFLFLILIITIIDYSYIGTKAIGIDDGNIFLNYAHHFAQGEGFVFNTNGEKVEGFTSFLWVIICAIAYLITAQPELLLISFSLLLTSLTITSVFRAVKADIQVIYPAFTKYFFWIYTAFIISIGPSFVAWSVLSLMENGLWNYIFISLLILILSTVDSINISNKRKIATVILGCLLSLTRPEALAWNVVFTCILLYTLIQNKKRIYFSLAYLICFTVITISLILFRLHYFGFRFPNTYYAKISPDKVYNLTEGIKYALSFLTGFQSVISFLFILMAIVFAQTFFKLKILLKPNTGFLHEQLIIKKFTIVSVIILIGFFLPCTTGGDHFGSFRFYQPLLLLMTWSITIIVWLVKYYRINKPDVNKIFFITMFSFLLVVGLNTLIDLKNPAKTQLNFEFLLAQEGRDLGSSFNQTFPFKKPSTGLIAVGGFGLIYKGETVDLMGLNNTLMGHSEGDRKGIKNHAAFNKDVFYKLKPEILLPQLVNNIEEAKIKYFEMLDVNDFDNQAMKNIFNDDVFKKNYFPLFFYDKKNNKNYFIFAANDYINYIRNNKNLMIKYIQF